MRNSTITGLDIGTSAIKILTVSRKSNSQELEVLGKFSFPNSGMRKGVIIKPEEVSQKIKSALEEVRVQSNQRINDVVVNVTGTHIFSTSSCGSVVVSRADQNISREDIERVVQAAKTFPLLPNREIIDFFPKQFIIDGERGIKEPLGMKGVRLEAEILALGVFSPYFKNLTKAVLGSGLKISNIIFSGICSARACLTPQQKELGVAALDIGAGVTDLAIYEEGDLKYLAVLPMGSSNITNDIAIGLRTDTAIAEKIKKEFGYCLKSGDKKIFFPFEEQSSGAIQIPVYPVKSNKAGAKQSNETGGRGKAKKPQKKFSGNGLSFSSKFLNKIIEARVGEIFSLARKEIKKSSSGILPAGIVLTGGGARLNNIVELAKKELKLPARIGIPVSPEGKLEEDPSFSVAWGLVLSAMDEEPPSRDSWGGFGKGIIDKITKALKVFIP